MNKTDQSINFNISGIKLKFKSQAKELNEFIKAFTGFSVSTSKENDKYNIVVEFKNNEKMHIGKGFRKISRNIWLNENEIILTNFGRMPSLSFQIRAENNNFFIKAFLDQNRNGLFTRIWRNYLKTQRYLLLTYYLIFMPCFFYLERIRKHQLIHASAFEHRGKGIILTGLGGVGKSTLSLAALLWPENRFLSDNIIFYNDEKIYSLKSPIAADQKIVEQYEIIKNKLVAKQFNSHFNRMYYDLKQEFCVDQLMPEYLFWLQQSNVNLIIPMKNQNRDRNIVKINFLTDHLREYYIFAAAFDFILTKDKILADYLSNLHNFLESINCFILKFRPDDELNKIFNETIDKAVN